MNTLIDSQSGMTRGERKHKSMLGDKLLLSYDFDGNYMFKESDLENTDVWALVHDKIKSVKKPKIHRPQYSSFSYNLLSRQNRLSKLQ